MDQPASDRPSGSEDQASLRRLHVLVRPHRLRLAGAVAALIGLAAVNMSFPMMVKILIDDVFPHGNKALLWLMLLGLVLFYLVRNLLYFVSKTAAVHVGENVCFTIRNRLFNRMQHMNLQYTRKMGPGHVSSRVMSDSFVIQTFIQDELPKLVLALVLFLALVASLFAVNWQLALIATLVLPLHLLAFYRFKQPIKASSRKAQDQLDVVQGNLVERFLGVEVIKGFTAEQREGKAFVRATDESRRSQLHSRGYHIIQKVIADMLVGAGTIALVGFGAYQVIAPSPQRMEAGEFLMFFGWVAMLYPTVLGLMAGFAKLTRCTVSVDRVFDLLDAGSSERRLFGTAFKPIRGHLQLESVCFGYDEGEPVLRNVDLDVAPGQVCVVTGPSGSGKSTLAHLILRFYEPDLGRVLIDGLDVNKIDLQHLREHIGIAFQECFLFNSSIWENLRYANPDAAVTQIVDAAKLTGAHEFVTSLPNSYGTFVGESGVTLSRGERQRINLTRAILRDPKILILDEATASIDTESEARIVPAILDAMQDITILMITHRREMLRHADLVLRLDGPLATAVASEKRATEPSAGRHD